MWHLLKTEWAYKKYGYITAIVLSNLLFFHRYPNITKHPISSPEHCFTTLALMIACMVLSIVVMGTAEPFYTGKTMSNLTVRFHSLHPLSIRKYQLVRYMTDVPLLVAILTIGITGYLFLFYKSASDCYLLVFIFGLIFFCCQILSYTLCDLSTFTPSLTWLASKGIQLTVAIFLAPIVVLVAGFGGILTHPIFYSYIVETAIITLLFTCGLVALNFHFFSQRNSFLG